MTQPEREPTPMPGKPWSCPRCRQPIGHLAHGNLHITASGATVERAVLGIVVRCVCGQTKAFSGRRVLIDVPEGKAA